jgi:hypothetical protein
MNRRLIKSTLIALLAGTGLLVSLTAANFSTNLSYNPAFQSGSRATAAAHVITVGHKHKKSKPVVVKPLIWSAAQGIDPAGDIGAVSCSSPSFCVAVDAVGNSLTWNGKRWALTQGLEPPSNDGDSLTAVSCVSATRAAPAVISHKKHHKKSLPGQFCMVGDSAGNALMGNRYKWSTLSSVDSSGSGLMSISCASDKFCAAVDNIGSALTWNGTTWSALQPVVPSSDSLDSISCLAANYCLAVDMDGNAYIWNGSTWSAPLAVDPNNGGNFEASCASENFCAAVDQNGDALTWNGSAWSAPLVLETSGAGFASISCALTQFCVAVDNEGNELTYSGGKWSSIHTIDPSGAFAAVSCVSAMFCVAANNVGGVLVGRS